MIVTPLEIFSLLRGFQLPEFAIIAMLFPQVHAVRAIFLVVLRMIVTAVPVVILFVMMIVSHYGNWNRQASAG